MTTIAVAVFIVGFYIAAREVDLDKIHSLPVLLNAVVVNPIVILVSAISLRQMALVGGHSLTFRTAFEATVYGRAAEFLPVPGTVIASGTALIRSGVNARMTASVMTASALLLLALSGLIGGVPIYLTYPALGVLVLGVSSAVCLATTWWIHSRVGLRHTVLISLVRLTNVALSIVRAFLSFAAIGAQVPLHKITVFAVNGTLTSIIGIVPAGIGIGELMAMGLALTVAVPPATAFLAIAVNRLTGMFVSTILALYLWGSRSVRQSI